MADFTEGPWAVFLADNGNLLGVGEQETCDGITDGRFGLWRDGTEKLANAHLIAAAPDMYEALKAQQAIIEGLQKAIALYLPSGKSAKGMLSEVIGRIDGPEQRRALRKYETAKAKAEGKQ